MYGTHITRIGDAGQRHAYSRIQPWSPSEKYLYLYYGGGWLLDGRTYSRIRQISPGYVATWISDSEMVATQGSNLVRYNVDTLQTTVLHSFPQSVSIGEGEGAPSDDFRYWALQGGSTVYVYDRTTDAVITTINAGTTPNNVTMSRKGGYLIVQYSSSGTGQTNGTWLFTRAGSRIRQMWPGPVHMDPCVDAQGAECAVGVSGSYNLLDYHRLSDGVHRSLIAPANVWAWVGHVSCRMPGWCVSSPDSWHSNGTAGNDQLISFDLSKTNATTVKVWGHERAWSGITYEQQPMGIQSPSGTRVLFASGWVKGTTTYYPFVAEP